MVIEFVTESLYHDLAGGKTQGKASRNARGLCLTLEDGTEVTPVGPKTGKGTLLPSGKMRWLTMSFRMKCPMSRFDPNALISEIESLLVRIANPKGNRAVPKGAASSALPKKLKSMVKQKQKEELDEMFGVSTAAREERAGKRPPKHRKLEGLVSRSTPLYKTFKGKEYRATLTSSGIIKMGKRRFTSPSGAAKAIVRRPTVNGWRFWYIKDLDGSWVRLCDYKS